MADQYVRQTVSVNDGTCSVCADVVTSRDPHGTAEAVVHAAAGHIAPGTRAKLIDAVLDLPEMRASDHLVATVPLGDAESLFRIEERCDDVTVRAAGSSALVEADLDG